MRFVFLQKEDAFQEMNCHLSNDTEASITTIAGGNIDESSWTLLKRLLIALIIHVKTMENASKTVAKQNRLSAYVT